MEVEVGECRVVEDVGILGVEGVGADYGLEFLGGVGFVRVSSLVSEINVDS